MNLQTMEWGPGDIALTTRPLTFINLKILCPWMGREMLPHVMVKIPLEHKRPRRTLQIYIIVAAVRWLGYCRYGVKSIN